MRVRINVFRDGESGIYMTDTINIDNEADIYQATQDITDFLEESFISIQEGD